MSTTFNTLIALALVGISLTHVAAIKGFGLKEISNKVFHLKEDKKTEPLKTGSDYSIPSVFLFN